MDRRRLPLPALQESIVTPYITPAMLIASALGVDWTSVPVPGATSQQQTAEQANICQRATDWVDMACGQILRATVDTEEEMGPHTRLTIMSNGCARLQLSRWPVLQVLAAKVANATTFPLTYTTVPLDHVATEYAALTQLGTVAADGAGIGPTAVIVAPGFLSWVNGRQGYRLQVQYVNGWPHCGITATANSGANTLTVDDCTGWAGVTGRIFDGAGTESVAVTSASVASGPGTLTLGSNLVNTHTGTTAAPIVFSALPGTAILAALYHAAAQVEGRGVMAIDVPELSGAESSAGGKDAGDLITEAEVMLAHYARIF